MLAEVVSQRVTSAFPRMSICVTLDKEAFVTIAPAWEGFGPITFLLEQEEVIVIFGVFTHSHFYGTPDAIALAIVDVLQITFEDQYVFEVCSRGGGFIVDGEVSIWSDPDVRRGRWSGPVV